MAVNNEHFFQAGLENVYDKHLEKHLGSPMIVVCFYRITANAILSVQ
jgi:hypothetical protein